MKIEIWSDIICPYCYIGKRVFENVLKKNPLIPKPEIVWRSYQLDPSLEAGNRIDYYRYVADMKGVAYEEAIADRNKVVAKAGEVGLVYNFDKAILTNTFDAHRLIHLAGKFQLGSEAKELLFKAHFTDGLDVSDKNVLTNVGIQIGLSENDVIQMLNSDDLADEIHADITEADKLDLYYVPFFLFERKHIVTGVVSEDDFLKVLNKLIDSSKGETDSEAESIHGKSCNLDGTCC